MTPHQIGEGLSSEERRELLRSSKRRWRWPWQKTHLVRMRLPVESLRRLRDLGLYKLRGDVNHITKLGRAVAQELQKRG